MSTKINNFNFLTVFFPQPIHCHSIFALFFFFALEKDNSRRNYTPPRLYGLVYGVFCHYQQYFSYIVVVSFIGGGNRVPGENHRPATGH
jgi:hypothetical protein